jgi:hypothetical protein
MMVRGDGEDAVRKGTRRWWQNFGTLKGTKLKFIWVRVTCLGHVNIYWQH